MSASNIALHCAWNTIWWQFKSSAQLKKEFFRKIVECDQHERSEHTQLDYTISFKTLYYHSRSVCLFDFYALLNFFSLYRFTTVSMLVLSWTEWVENLWLNSRGVHFTGRFYAIKGGGIILLEVETTLILGEIMWMGSSLMLKKIIGTWLTSWDFRYF